MKKLLLSLGTLTAVAIPVVAVVSCGEPRSDVSMKTGAIMLKDGYKKGFQIDEVKVNDGTATVIAYEKSDSTLVETNRLLQHRLTLPKMYGMNGDNHKVISGVYDLGAGVLELENA